MKKKEIRPMTLKQQFLQTNWFSRKLVVGVVLEAMITIFLFIGMANTDQWINFSKIVFLVYAGSNGVSKFSGFMNASPRRPSNYYTSDDEENGEI